MVASAPNVKATAERSPGRSEPKRTIASTLATSATPAASACCVSGTPAVLCRNASSNAWARATTTAPLKTSASMEVRVLESIHGACRQHAPRAMEPTGVRQGLRSRTSGAARRT
jgi:hypothetical protein